MVAMPWTLWTEPLTRTPAACSAGWFNIMRKTMVGLSIGRMDVSRCPTIINYIYSLHWVLFLGCFSWSKEVWVWFINRVAAAKVPKNKKGLAPQLYRLCCSDRLQSCQSASTRDFRDSPGQCWIWTTVRSTPAFFCQALRSASKRFEWLLHIDQPCKKWGPKWRMI